MEIEREGADALLAALGRDADDAGPGIVAKIKADQDELIRTPLDNLLIIEGGPGTGKTMTALHRVAWLLDEGHLSPADVLVVGPSAAFARYTESVLTALGHDEVEHRSLDALLPAGAAGREESLYVTRLKGESRMAGLLARAVENHQGRLPANLPTALTIDGEDFPLDPVRLTQVLSTARASEAPEGDRRRILRAVLVSGSKDPRRALAAADALAELLWPPFDPAGFLRELYASREALAAAAGGEFTEREISALYRSPADADADADWSDADLPLLDEAEHLVGDESGGYAHLVVDEAQDLSPMQVRAVARRSATGSMTLVGDMAQSTGPWARDDWHDVLAQLPDDPPRVHRELRFGYRVPRQIFDLAGELLPTAAPSVQAPTTVRDGPAEPVLIPVDPADRARVVVAAAADHAADGGAVAILCPAPCRAEIEARLLSEDVPWRPAASSGAGAGITVLTPQEAKGLEFDVAVVVEPGFIVDDDPRGHRLLYIALTRATGYLYLVGAPEDLPVDFGGDVAAPQSAVPLSAVPAPVEPSDPAPLDPAVREAIDMVAHAVAETLLANLTPQLWPIALERVVDLITPDSSSAYNHDLDHDLDHGLDHGLRNGSHPEDAEQG
ncbi:MAG: UvrD-helicase domain-containing protein [Actinoplanes sp.]